MRRHVNLMDCCGIHGVSALSYMDERDFYRELYAHLSPMNGAMFLASTTTRQEAAIRYLKKVGFEELMRGRNSNSTNTVILWGIKRRTFNTNCPKAIRGEMIEFNKTKKNKYNPEKVIKELEHTLKYIKEADDQGSVDFALGFLQEYFYNIDPILTKEGGI